MNKIKQSDQKEIEISSKDLLEEFRDDCLQNGSEFKTTPIKFGIKLKKYTIDGFVTKKTKKLSV